MRVLRFVPDQKKTALEMNSARQLRLPSTDKRPVNSIVGVSMEMVGACWQVPGLHVPGVEKVTDLKVLYLYESEMLATSLLKEKNEAHRGFASVATILRSIFGRSVSTPPLSLRAGFCSPS